MENVPGMFVFVVVVVFAFFKPFQARYGWCGGIIWCGLV